jgi:AmmeMemoRadiSam system protein A
MASGKDKVGVDLGLSNSEKEDLLKVARNAIEARVRGNRNPPGVGTVSGSLAEPRGAFVSLYKKGMLRGCIGSVISDNALAETVEEMAIAAATRDPRFRPVTPEELPYIELEISALTPFQEIDDPDLIEVGTHGIMIKKGPYSGLLLPQVATERNWDSHTFLRETCRKAGLDPDAWKDSDARIYVFSADVFQ